MYSYKKLAAESEIESIYINKVKFNYHLFEEAEVEG